MSGENARAANLMKVLVRAKVGDTADIDVPLLWPRPARNARGYTCIYDDTCLDLRKMHFVEQF